MEGCRLPHHSGAGRSHGREITIHLHIAVGLEHERSRCDGIDRVHANLEEGKSSRLRGLPERRHHGTKQIEHTGDRIGRGGAELDLAAWLERNGTLPRKPEAWRPLGRQLLLPAQRRSIASEETAGIQVALLRHDRTGFEIIGAEGDEFDSAPTRPIPAG